MSHAAPAAIRAIGTAVPPWSYRQNDIAAFMTRALRADRRLSRRIGALYRHSRIETRHSCLADFDAPLGQSALLPDDWATCAGPSTAARMRVYCQHAGSLAAEAARDAFSELRGFDRARVTHLVVASCTGFMAPGIDVELVERLGLRAHVARTLIGFQGCHAGLAALRVADAFCRSDPTAWVLVVCVELCSIHFQTAPADDNLLANAIFADGAAAALVHAGHGLREIESRAFDRDQLADGNEPFAGSEPSRGDRSGGTEPSEGTEPSGGTEPHGGDGTSDGDETPGWIRILRCGSWLEAGTEREMVWSIGDHGFEMRLSALVPHFLGSSVARFLEQTLTLGNDEREALDFWAVHPGGPAILDQLERALGLAPHDLKASRTVLRDFGNMSSPTILFVLDRIRRTAARSGTRTAARGSDSLDRPLGQRRGVALAFGPGLTIEGLVFQVED